MPKRSFFKNVSARVEIPFTQQQEMARLLRSLVYPTNITIRMFLFGWKNRDDGLYEELRIPSAQMSKTEFTDGTTLMLRSLMETRIAIRTDKDGKQYEAKEKISGRAFQAPIFGESRVGDSTWMAQPFLAKLRMLGILPLLAPGLCPAERYIVGDLRADDFPRIAEAEPLVGDFHLPAILDDLIEDAEFVADAVAGRGHFEGRE